MNRTLTVGMFAGIFAIAIGAIVLSGDSASTYMVSATPKTQESMGMMGHVEYTVLDESGLVKGYMQTDNVVTEIGRQCAASALFDQDDFPEACSASTEFQYIAIGNGTNGAGVLVADTSLDTGSNDADSDDCADTGTGALEGGEMARKQVDPVITLSGSDTVVTLDTSGDPFKFGANNASNAITVLQSGIFNGDVHARDATNGHCTDNNTSVDDMFAIQELNGATGITVSSGDSLSVKWTITIGTV